MKRQIDPNLSNNTESELLFGENAILDDFKIENSKDDIVDTVLNATESINDKKDSLNIANVSSGDNKKSHSHHHHSSGEHHHHSSGEHHHHHSSGSDSSRHHTNGSHHHSGESHHHHSSSSHHSSGSHHHSSSTHHHSKHHSKSKKKKMPTWLKIVIAIILILALLIGGTFGAYVTIKKSGGNELTSIAKSDTQHQEIITYNGHRYEFNKNIVSIAFMGVDQRELLDNTETSFVGCADADIVVTIDTKTGAAKIIAIPRDTMVDVDQYSSNNVFLKTSNVQLCLAYAYGDGKTKSCTNITKAMSRILYNVPIQKYIALDLDGIAPLNDAMGGVTVNSIYDIPSFGIKNGEKVKLKGDMAEAYVRSRDMDTINASLHRTERQVQYVKAFINQLIPAVRKDVTIVSQLYETSQKYSQTNLSLNNVTYLASLLLEKGVRDYDVYTIQGSMKESKESPFPDTVYAEFTPDEDNLMQTVLDVYYTQID